MSDVRPTPVEPDGPAPRGPGPDGADVVRTDVRIDDLRFGPDGLLPAVVVDAGDGAVLMLAWMSRESLERSVASGRTVFWSRSRGELWEKGATSGHVQRILDVRVDCDADALVITVDQAGVACHTGERTCFHRGLAS